MRPSEQQPAAIEAPSAIDLYWIPLGAGGHSVRFNGKVYEAIAATLQRRRPLDIYHCALTVHHDGSAYTIEMTPVPNGRSWERGVVAGGAVGSRSAGRFRMFRYEVRCWRDGVIPDLEFATSRLRVTSDPAAVQRLFAVLPSVPDLVWGRDELRTGEMWSCNSIISWTLTNAGIDAQAIPLPAEGRAPGWDAGITIARHGPSDRKAAKRTAVRAA